MLVAAAVGCMVGVAVTTLMSGRNGVAIAQERATRVAPESERDFIRAIAKVGPAVVNINTVFRPPNLPPLLREFFGEPFPREGQASGVIIDNKRGYVLTNNHVVENARSVKVSLADGRSFDAMVVGTDPLSDIGVVQIKGDSLPAAELGRSADVPVGGWLIAIGNPFGYENTVTVGVLSARNRRLRAPSGVGLENMLQTDAAINPGNSGGALVDITGKVVGIPTAIIPYAQGIGFAIAAETASKVAQQLIATGHVSHPWLGISYVPVTEEVQQALKLPSRKGIAVAEVQPGGPADQAGIKANDVILRLGLRDVNTADDLSAVVRQTKVGDKLTATVSRAGRAMQVTITVGERPAPPPGM
jgi:serine protease Do